MSAEGPTAGLPWLGFVSWLVGSGWVLWSGRRLVRWWVPVGCVSGRQRWRLIVPDRALPVALEFVSPEDAG